MNKREEAIRSMYIAVRDYLNTEIAVWTGSAGMTNAVGMLTSHIENIDNYSMGQQQDTKGATGSKGLKREVLVEKIIGVASGLIAYGNATGDKTLAGKANVKKRKLDLDADTFIGDAAANIIKLGNVHVAALADYNISAGDIAALEAARMAFMHEIQKPKNLIGSRKTNTSGLKNEFRATTQFLKEVLDMLVRTYASSNKNFVLAYFNNREIYDIGSTGIAVRFHVDEAATGKGLGLVVVDVMPGNIKKRTTAKGNAQIKFLHSGTYTASFSRAGFLNKEVTFYVTEGAMTKVRVELGIENV